ncbi:hypothetical protein GCM10009127_27710 [Alteraurantiacibacter aestuarii]|uniref:Uncharacterized protein n=1 Tax=Alteraurantiacibacter aestuarii TaxID=650004 RepID=A0A844ZKB2_9SPHN|nr:hypothetical protein [Alteraurantiacibacter aestuarii]MXO88881.1 hypothetical protein [Alteraurantiacibacter aestuarii]
MDRETQEQKAKQRFFMINAMRMAGVAMVLIGILVMQGMFGLPEWTAYLLIGLGLVETFVTPQILARMWSSEKGGPGER